jgi:hypothetical protein
MTGDRQKPHRVLVMLELNGLASMSSLAGHFQRGSILRVWTSSGYTSMEVVEVQINVLRSLGSCLGSVNVPSKPKRRARKPRARKPRARKAR